MFEVLSYQDDEGEKPYANWLSKLADRHAKARVMETEIDAAVGYWNDWKRKNAK